MNKKDILRRAKMEKKDEREEHIKNRAFFIGWIGVTVVILLIIIFRFIYKEPASDMLMILMAQIASVSFYQYFTIRNKKSYLFTGSMSTVAIFLALAALLSEYGIY